MGTGGRGTDPVVQAGPAAGTPLQVVTGPDTFPLAAIGTLDPRNAAAEVLAAFLRCATFVRGGDAVADKPFALERVFAWWPDAKREIEYPSASVTDAGAQAYEAHNLVPSALEESWDVWGRGTVLWKTAELALRFQVDFWCVDDPTREAIAARLPSLFAPGEGRYGVLLAGDARYFRRPVRATLLEYERVETPEAVFGRERRLRTLVACEIDVVHLRCAVELAPRVVVDVIEASQVSGPLAFPETFLPTQVLAGGVPVVVGGLPCVVGG